MVEIAVNVMAEINVMAGTGWDAGTVGTLIRNRWDRSTNKVEIEARRKCVQNPRTRSGKPAALNARICPQKIAFRCVTWFLSKARSLTYHAKFARVVHELRNEAKGFRRFDPRAST